MNYQQMKNYIHNDLGISKEDIKNAIWEAINQTINEEVNKCLNDKERIKTLVGGQVRYELMKDSPRRTYLHSTLDEIYNKIDSVIHEEVRKRLIIDLMEPEELKDKITLLEYENNKLKQWDCNKDTRNSRQRRANALQSKAINKYKSALVKVHDNLVSSNCDIKEVIKYLEDVIEGKL